MHIVVYLLIPLAISYLFWKLKPSIPPQTNAFLVRSMGWGSTLALMVFVVGVMSKIHVGDMEESTDLLIYFTLAVGLSIIMYIMTGIMFARFGRVDSLTAGMLVANRNVALSFGLLAEVFPEEVMIYVAVSQFPIFLTPIVVRIYRMVQAAYQDHARRAGLHSAD
jgi:BASS family bile acid:Na+ symporter